MRIERLHSNAWRRLEAVRLRALADAPDAFGSTLAEAERYREADWRRQLAALPTYVGVLADQDVGMVRGAADPENTGAALLLSMWVAPEARGQGMGEALIRQLADWASATGYSRLLLDVADGNQPAIRLYARMGFTPTGVTGSLPAPRTHITEHQRVLEL